MTLAVETHEERAYWTCIATVINGVPGLIGARAWRVRGSLAIDLHLGGALGRRPADMDVDIEAQPDHEPLLLPGDRGHGFRVVRRESVRFTRPLPDRRVDRVIVEVGGEERPERRLLLGVTYRHLKRADALLLPLRPLLDVKVPVLSLERCVAEKLLRYCTPRTSGRVKTKWVDLFDILAVAEGASRLRLASLKAALQRQSSDWQVDVPSVVPRPPLEWLDHWDGAMFQSGFQFGDLNDAYLRLYDFVQPILHRTDSTILMSWDRNAWTWRPDH